MLNFLTYIIPIIVMATSLTFLPISLIVIPKKSFTNNTANCTSIILIKKLALYFSKTNITQDVKLSGRAI